MSFCGFESGRRDERMTRLFILFAKNFRKKFRPTRGLALAALGALLFAVGCGKDTPDSYPLTGKDGAPLTADEAKAISDAHLPATKTPPLTPDDINAKVEKAKNDLKQKQGLPTEAQVGIPFYPGAQPHKNKGDMTLTTESENAILLTLETADSVAKVDAFYKGMLPLAHRLQDTIAGKQTIGYVDESEIGRKRSVDISAESGKTVIALITTRAPKDAMPALSKDATPAKDATPIRN